MSNWTLFWDMHSGGGLKEPPYSKIYIEAPKLEAISIFYARFGHNPTRVSCACCGEDYAIDEYQTLEKASEFHRDEGRQSLEEYVKGEEILIIESKDIESNERTADVPEQRRDWNV